MVRISIARLVPQPAENVHPWRSCGDGGPDGWRPQRALAGPERRIPALDNALRLGLCALGFGPRPPRRVHIGDARSVSHSAILADLTGASTMAASAARGHGRANNSSAAPRFLATQFLAINGLGDQPPGFDNNNYWLDSDRTDFANTSRR
jgi:hypothetical protein